MKLFLAVLACLAAVQAAEIRFQSPMTVREAQEQADKSHTRIVNGFPAAPGQFPYQVSLRGFRASGSGRCGGSLISNEWILTAAHCITNVVRYEIAMGDIDRTRPEVLGTSTHFMIHPAYNPSNLNNDIGLIKLDQPVTFSQNIQPIALPAADRTGETFVDVRATVSGFGRIDQDVSGGSDILQWVNIRVISNAQCMLTYGSSVVIPSTICGMGADQDNQSPCSGDSGGPLTMQENGNSVQIGVVSFVASSGCANGRPSGYVRTTHFRSWINQETGV